MDTSGKTIGLMDHVGPSIDHTKAILFAPFDLNRWLAIGFCAWLASFGEGGGPNVKYEQHQQEADELVQFITANPVLLGILVVLVIVLTVLFIWLSSRGRFMFYHCVLYNSDQVVHPWHYYQHLAGSLFRFRLILAAIGIVWGLAVVAIITNFGGSLEINNLSRAWPKLLPLLPLALIPIGLLICDVLTTDFVIPIMHKHTLTCTAAWSRLGSLLSAHAFAFFLYLLFKVLLSVALVTALVLLGMVTCGCACCLSALPYLGTVFLLPVPTFKRSFSLHYLRQFGPEFDLFATEPDPIDTDTESSPNDYSI